MKKKISIDCILFTENEIAIIYEKLKGITMDDDLNQFQFHNFLLEMAVL